MKAFLALALSSSLAMANPLVVGGGNAGPTSVTTYEGFETTGAPSGLWTDTSSGNTVNWDYTASPLAGAQSLFMADSTSGFRQITYDFPEDADEIWIAFRIRHSALPSANSTYLSITDSAGNALANSRITTGGNVSAAVDTTQGLTAVIISAGSEWRLKYRYKRGTGSNEELSVVGGTTSFGTIRTQTNGTSTARAGKIIITEQNNVNADLTIDNVFIKTSDITWAELD
jgi:hypothetical protein